MVAAMAKYRHVPVIFAAETYKFSDKVQLDSIVYNELADPAELFAADRFQQSSGGAGFKIASPLEEDAESRQQVAAQKYSIVNLRYDLTPVSYISMIATETGLIPPTSVPVIVRELRYIESVDCAR